jgi:uncharacterized protein (TIGR02996 family)
MTEREALVAAIAADPKDDTPRLIFADWFQENGEDDRAEFIRLQCDLSHAHDDRAPANSPDKFKRVVELFTTHWQEWMSPLFSALGVYAPEPPKVLPHSPNIATAGATINCLNPLSVGRRDHCEFLTGLFIDRGFVTGIDIHTANRKRPCSLAEAFRLEPITSLDVRLPTNPPNGHDLLEPCLEQVHSLNVRLDGPDSPAIPDGLAQFLNVRLWTGLRYFGIASSVAGGLPLPAKCARVLSSCEWLQNLTLLRTPLTNQSFEEVLLSPKLSNLVSLVLPDSRLSPETIARFAELPFLTQLKKLKLSRSGLSHRHVSALAAIPNWDSLHVLNLGDNPITDAGAFALSRSTMLRKLRKLKMPGTELGIDGLLAIAKALDPQRIEFVDFNNNNIEPIFKHSLRERFGDRIQLNSR